MKRILIADDDADNRAILQRRLSRRGFEVSLAQDGEEALAALAAQAFDAILLDSLMPNLSGLEVLRQMRAAGDSTRVIMVTGKVTTMDVERAMATGADAYVTKPVDFQKLVGILES